MPVPGIVEEILELTDLVPQERIQERIVEEIIDVPVPEVMEKTVKSLVCHFHRLRRKFGR